MSLWGAQRRLTFDTRLVEADALGAPLYHELNFTDAALGKESMNLSLPSVIFDLRLHLERQARSVAFSPGTFVYLDGKSIFAAGSGCVALTETELVLTGAARAHADWDASAAKGPLTSWASTRALRLLYLWRAIGGPCATACRIAGPGVAWLARNGPLRVLAARETPPHTAQRGASPRLGTPCVRAPCARCTYGGLLGVFLRQPAQLQGLAWRGWLAVAPRVCWRA